MKVALIRKEYVALRGGAERYAVNLARGLAERGHDVHIFAGIWEDTQNKNITFHRVPYNKSPSPLKNFSFQRNARKLVASGEFDIVNGLSQVFPQDVYRVGEPLHIHWLRAYVPNPRKRLAKYLSPRHQMLLSIERNIFKKCNYRRIIVNSQLCRNQIINYYGVPEEKISLVRNGVDLSIFTAEMRAQTRAGVRQSLNISEHDTVLLFAGNDFKRKGLQFAVKCVEDLKALGHTTTLLVAGRGSPAPFLRIAKKRGFSNILHFLGGVSDIRELYYAADMLIHPALYDPFSNACLEAMACGLPVVTTRLNGAAEIIAHGVSGIVINAPEEVEKMVSEIINLLGFNRSCLSSMSEMATLRAKDFPVAANVEKTLAVYRDILDEKRGTPA
ncbi:MAG: glycosyltransferase family 4 protein [Pseudomonadota bacterium]